MRRVFLFTLLILLLPTADMISTDSFVEWEFIDQGSYTIFGYPFVQYPNGNLGVFRNHKTLIYNSSFIYDENLHINNFWLYHFNETYSYYYPGLAGTIEQAFYNPIKNETYLVNDDYSVFKYNDTYYINQTDIGIGEGISVSWYNLTNQYEYSFRPLVRPGTKMVYDYINNIIFLYGGSSGSYFADTWIFDIFTTEWRQLTPPTQPGLRARHGLVYNEFDGKIYLFGGWDGSDTYDDLWMYDYLSNYWIEILMNNSPGKRYNHGMIYDSYNHKILVYRGNANQDLWAYDFKSKYWTFLSANTGPSGGDRNDWIMYDNSSLLLHGDFYKLNLELSSSPPSTEIIVTHTETVTTATTSTDYTTITDQKTEINYEDVTRYQNITSLFDGTTDETPFYTLGVLSVILVAIVIKRKKSR